LADIIDEFHEVKPYVDPRIKRLSRKIWFFEWCLMFMILYMMWIAYNQYQLSYDVLAIQMQAAPPIFTP